MTALLPREERTLAGRTCAVLRTEQPAALLIQPADSYDLAGLDREAELLAEGGRGFLLCAFRVEDWNRELSPWDAPPVFGREGFGHGAGDTLRDVEALIPAVSARYGLPTGIPVILGGYSLAGLFALWSVWERDCFAGAAAASPSVWFPGWTEHAAARPPQTRLICLSLGDREEKTRNPVMARVGDAIRALHAGLVRGGIDTTLVWNPGNHFREPEARTARAFRWCLDRIPPQASETSE